MFWCRLRMGAKFRGIPKGVKVTGSTGGFTVGGDFRGVGGCGWRRGLDVGWGLLGGAVKIGDLRISQGMDRGMEGFVARRKAARDPLQCSGQAGVAELASRAGRASLKHAATLFRLTLRASAAPNPSPVHALGFPWDFDFRGPRPCAGISLGLRFSRPRSIPLDFLWFPISAGRSSGRFPVYSLRFRQGFQLCNGIVRVFAADWMAKKRPSSPNPSLEHVSAVQSVVRVSRSANAQETCRTWVPVASRVGRAAQLEQPKSDRLLARISHTGAKRGCRCGAPHGPNDAEGAAHTTSKGRKGVRRATVSASVAAAVTVGEIRARYGTTLKNQRSAFWIMRLWNPMISRANPMVPRKSTRVAPMSFMRLGSKTSTHARATMIRPPISLRLRP